MSLERKHALATGMIRTLADHLGLELVSHSAARPDECEGICPDRGFEAILTYDVTAKGRLISRTMGSPAIGWWTFVPKEPL